MDLDLPVLEDFFFMRTMEEKTRVREPYETEKPLPQFGRPKDKSFAVLTLARLRNGKLRRSKGKEKEENKELHHG